MPFEPYFNRWCHIADHGVGPHRLSVLTEQRGVRGAIAPDLDASVLDNYDDLQRLERWATQLGLPNAASVLHNTLPETARARSGHVGEILLTESVPELFPDFIVPIKRLRWIDGRNMALRGEDFIGVDRRGRQVRFLKAESKSRAVLAAGVIQEARAALNNNGGRPSGYALLFIARRLDEIGQRDLSAVFLENAVRQQIEDAQMVHLLFTFSGNDSTELLRTNLRTCAGPIQQQAVGLVIADHQEFILAIYTRLANAAQLSTRAAELNSLLVASDAEFLAGDVENAITHTLEFARIAFAIAPFDLEEFPAGWENIIRQWILGYSLADIAGGIESEVVSFAENALVYKLVWALEAIRVRAIAAGELDEDSFNGFTAMSVETGTNLYAASLLIHCGLASRAAAIKAVNDENGDFTDTREMRRWIFSPAVKRRTLDANWPTPTTGSLWRDFVDGLGRETLEKWDETNFETAINWHAEPLRVGTPVRIKNGKAVFSIKWDPVGELLQEISDTGGVFVAHVSNTRQTILGQYIGPRR